MKRCGVKRFGFSLSLLFLSLVFVAVQSSERELTVEEMIKLAREDSKVMDHLDHLVNKIGPRLTSSDNLTKACEWARDTFKSFGLDARMEEWGTFPVGFNRGPWKGRMVAPTEKVLHFGTNSWTPGTNGPVAGPAVMAPDSEEGIEAVKSKLKGAWMVFAKRPGTDLRKKLDAVFDEAGIAGVIYGNRNELIVTSGNYQIKWDKLPTRVILTMVKSEFDEIVKLLRDGKDVRLEFDIKNEFKQGPIKLYNVIADLRGTEKPDEYVIVGGHIDSWDGAAGTTDNGTGCATAIEAARILTKAGVKPKRTIRFMLWSGEEQGLLGSLAYVKAHPEEMKKISAVFVHDMGTNYLSGISATEAILPFFEKVFEPVKKLDKDMPFEVAKVEGLTGGGSDHASFLFAGVPGLFWYQDGEAKYGYTHHTQHDRYDQAISKYQKHSSIVIAIAARGVANLDGLLPREGLTKEQSGEKRRRLGINTDEETMEITDVTEGMPADKAGIKPGDIILKVGGKKVSKLSELIKAIQEAEIKSTVVIKRDGKELELPVTFDR